MNRPLADIRGQAARDTEVFMRFIWAADEIAQATAAHPHAADQLHHAGPLLTPRFAQMATEIVYRSHCRELLHRVAAGEDTRPATAAEVCCMLADISAVVRINPEAVGLYLRMFSAVAPEQEPFLDRNFYETTMGSTIDDYEALTRRKLADRRRMPSSDVECDGAHNPDCHYARPVQLTLDGT